MAMLARFNPAPDVSILNRQVERFFDDMFGRALWRNGEERPLRGSWAPAVNILERDDAVVITADLPGLAPEDVEVTVDQRTLSIRGERKLEEARDGETYHHVERLYGMFERTFNLPSSIDSSKIEARFSNGEMVLTLPKLEESKPRMVKIKVEQN
ncbi:MAG: Hsp20/alpha crystallin family protein [Thermoanaerobaculales bacterium]